MRVQPYSSPWEGLAPEPELVVGVRSACTYAGARTLEELHQRAVVSVQRAAGYEEGRPVKVSW